MTIFYIDRKSGRIKQEEIYGQTALNFLYGQSLNFCGLNLLARYLVTKVPLFSYLYGRWQKSSWTKKKVKPFIDKFNIDESEFVTKSSEFKSFNDFFIRKLKPEKRPVNPDPKVAIIPADGRYRFMPDISLQESFTVKEKLFTLESFLNSATLAKKYSGGSLALARLAPVDYHRFHFPCNAFASKSCIINGALYSVNPLAIQRNYQLYAGNKRAICELKSDSFGDIIFAEVGATFVGSICQTYSPGKQYQKGDEKGFFEFGGSALVLLFEKNRIEFDADLTKSSASGHEIYCQMGQSMGRSTPL